MDLLCLRHHPSLVEKCKKKVFVPKNRKSALTSRADTQTTSLWLFSLVSSAAPVSAEASCLHTSIQNWRAITASPRWWWRGGGCKHSSCACWGRSLRWWRRSAGMDGDLRAPSDPPIASSSSPHANAPRPWQPTAHAHDAHLPALVAAVALVASAASPAASCCSRRPSTSGSSLRMKRSQVAQRRLRHLPLRWWFKAMSNGDSSFSCIKWLLTSLVDPIHVDDFWFSTLITGKWGGGCGQCCSTCRIKETDPGGFILTDGRRCSRETE
jgi:hypothetical protein